jgi:hypothetical protein
MGKRIIKAEGEIRENGEINLTSGASMKDFQAFYQGINIKTCNSLLDETKISWTQGASKQAIIVYGQEFSHQSIECALVRSGSAIIKNLNSEIVESHRAELNDFMTKLDGNCQAYTPSIALTKLGEIIGDCSEIDSEL